MTTEVVATRPTTTYKELAGLIQENRIGALPIVDVVGSEGRLVGIVSEADLLVKEEVAQRRQEPKVRGRGDQARALARTAKDLMTSPVVTVQPDETLTRAAHLMHRKHVKHLPVVDADGRLVGIVSRSDLVKVFLRADESILQDVQEEVLQGMLGLPPGSVEVAVHDGVVSLEGEVETSGLAALAARLVRGVEGVVGVDCRFGFRYDDTPHGLPPSVLAFPPPPDRGKRERLGGPNPNPSRQDP